MKSPQTVCITNNAMLIHNSNLLLTQHFNGNHSWDPKATIARIQIEKQTLSSSSDNFLSIMSNVNVNRNNAQLDKEPVVLPVVGVEPPRGREVKPPRYHRRMD